MQNELEARDFSPDQSPDLIIHPPKPPVNKRYRSGRTCNNCILYHCRSDFKEGCSYHAPELAHL